MLLLPELLAHLIFCCCCDKPLTSPERRNQPAVKAGCVQLHVSVRSGAGRKAIGTLSASHLLLLLLLWMLLVLTVPRWRQGDRVSCMLICKVTQYNDSCGE